MALDIWGILDISKGSKRMWDDNECFFENECKAKSSRNVYKGGWSKTQTVVRTSRPIYLPAGHEQIKSRAIGLHTENVPGKWITRIYLSATSPAGLKPDLSLSLDWEGAIMVMKRTTLQCVNGMQEVVARSQSQWAKARSEPKRFSQ